MLEERQNAPRRIFLLAALIPLVAVGLLVALQGGLTDATRLMAVILIPEGCLVFVFALLFTGLRVRVTDRALTARRIQGFGGIRLGPGDIDWCRAVHDLGLASEGDAPVTRTEWGPVRSLLLRTDTAIVLRTAARFIVVGTKQPEAFAQALGTMGVRVLPAGEGLKQSIRDGMSR